MKKIMVQELQVVDYDQLEWIIIFDVLNGGGDNAEWQIHDLW